MVDVTLLAWANNFPQLCDDVQVKVKKQSVELPVKNAIEELVGGVAVKAGVGATATAVSAAGPVVLPVAGVAALSAGLYGFFQHTAVGQSMINAYLISPEYFPTAADYSVYVQDWTIAQSKAKVASKVDTRTLADVKTVVIDPTQKVYRLAYIANNLLVKKDEKLSFGEAVGLV